jgi:hypothetical protein
MSCGENASLYALILSSARYTPTRVGKTRYARDNGPSRPRYVSMYKRYYLISPSVILIIQLLMCNSKIRFEL